MSEHSLSRGAVSKDAMCWGAQYVTRQLLQGAYAAPLHHRVFQASCTKCSSPHFRPHRPAQGHRHYRLVPWECSSFCFHSPR
jgi:hypothetical protein